MIENAGRHQSAGPVPAETHLAVMECGQYNQNWQNIHLMPEEGVQAAIDLQATQILPVHWGKLTASQFPEKVRLFLQQTTSLII